MAANSIHCILKSLAEIIMKITDFHVTSLLTLLKACYGSTTKAVKIHYNITKTFAKAVFSWIWAWSKCVLVCLRRNSKYTRDLLAVSIWYAKYLCGVMMAIYKATVSTIKQLYMGVRTDILGSGTRRCRILIIC
jgi:hypothetical protein